MYLEITGRTAQINHLGEDMFTKLDNTKNTRPSAGTSDLRQRMKSDDFVPGEYYFMIASA